MIEPLLTKSLDWAYEKEIRCIYSLSKKDSKIFQKTVYKNGEKEVLELLKMPKPVAVYVGCKASKDFIKQIKTIKQEIPIYKMSIEENQYQFKKTKV